MKYCTSLLLVLTVSGSLLFAAGTDKTLIDTAVVPRRDLTLIADPASFPPKPADLARMKARVLKAEQDAAVAGVAAIEARIRQIREESEARIKKLSDEREVLLKREREIGDTLKASLP